MNCPIRNVSCPEHGFIHGKEAEELREGIESILQSRDEYTAGAEDILEDLRMLLDRVDARDSLAWREAGGG